jgi:hypothetical protein
MSLAMTDIHINTTIVKKYSFKFESIVFVTNQSKTHQSCHIESIFCIKSGIFTFVRLRLICFWLSLNVKMQHKELF